MLRDEICQAIIDDAIVTCSRKSLPFTSVPLMLDHTARSLNAVGGEHIHDIKLHELRKHFTTFAQSLRTIQAKSNMEGAIKSIVVEDLETTLDRVVSIVSTVVEFKL